eukprot:1491037-Prymnesium_polylepis.3
MVVVAGCISNILAEEHGGVKLADAYGIYAEEIHELRKTLHVHCSRRSKDGMGPGCKSCTLEMELSYMRIRETKPKMVWESAATFRTHVDSTRGDSKLPPSPSPCSLLALPLLPSSPRLLLVSSSSPPRTSSSHLLASPPRLLASEWCLKNPPLLR